MSLTGKSNEQKIWNYLIAKGLSPYGAAGLMGNIQAESGFSPKNLQNSYEKKLGYTDTTYTAAVDDGSYTNFAHDSAGYGLCQWTYWSRKQALLEKAKSVKKSVGDMETQLDFMMSELAGYKGMMDILKNASTIREASDFVLLNFERPADQSENAKIKRAGFGQAIYDKYAKTATAPRTGGTTTMTEQQLRQNVADIISGWIGSKRGDAKHLEILDIYNNHKPLARGYKVKVSDPHCATTVSADYIKAGIAEFTGTECGVDEFIKIAQKKGIWVEDDAHVPKIGEATVYDWQDSGKGDNTGNGDHVGIVIKSANGKFTVAEGNMSGGKVGTREMEVNGRYIRGFICPDFAAAAKALSGVAVPTTPTTPTSPQPETSTGSEVVYVVKAGDTLSGIAAKYGTTYQVLASYNGIANPNIIRVGQKIRIPGKSAATTTPQASKPNTPATVKPEPAMYFDKAQARTYTVASSSGLNMRSGAGTGKTLLTTLAYGTKVTCYGYYNKVGSTIWLYVAVNGMTGYVCKSYLK